MIVKRPDSKGRMRYGVRVYRDGEKAWLGTFDRERDARRAERDALTDGLAAGQTPACDAFVRAWLAEGCPRVTGRKLKADSLHSYRQALGTFADDFAGRPLESVDRKEAFGWAQANKWRLQFVTALYSHARDPGWWRPTRSRGCA